MTSLNREFTRAAILYFWSCVKCGTEASTSYRVSPGDHVIQPSMPGGWTKIPGRENCFVCPKHRVEIVIDREPLD